MRLYMLTVRKSVQLIITTFLVLGQQPARAQVRDSTDLVLWYRQPAAQWTEALPIGNGRLGAMIFGGIGQERIQFNEETLWTGAPRDYNREGAAQYLPQIRQLLSEGRQKEAEQLAGEEFMGLMSDASKRAEWVKEVRALKGVEGNPALPAYDDRKWKDIAVPTYEGWETAGLEGLDGALWFRTTFDVPAGWTGKDLVLDLNRIRDHDFTYVNGKLVGTTEGTEPRKYIIPKEVIKPGRNILAIQVLNYYDKGGIAGYKDTSRHIGLYPEGSAEDAKIALPARWKYFIQNDEPPAVPHYQADYQPFGDVWLNFKNHTGATAYRRELNLSTAICRTTYDLKGVSYVREYFASQPNQAIVVHLGASQRGRISFEAILNSPHKKSITKKWDNRTLQLSVQVRNGALRGESFLQVVSKGGQTSIAGDKLVVEGADDVTLYVTAGTNYKSYHDVTADPAALNLKALSSVKGKTYTNLKAAHLREYQQYFNTFALDLGHSVPASLPANERIEKFASSADPSLAALYVQYGRYLLISSSRPGTRPANLQGIWNDLLTPPWGSKYTTNINLEMNYWPAEVLNLSPLHEPLFGMIEELAQAGKRTAKVYYDAPGWVLHHNTDVWRGTAPINASNHGIWVTGGAWLSQHLWERFLFTRDTAFLRKRAYPIMKNAALFFDHFLVPDPKTGWLISTPSNSPEQGGLVAGPSMDHQIIRTLFRNVIQASEVLQTDAVLRKRLSTKASQIAPNQIGKYGQLQEWLEDKDDTTNKHRHVSHLWGVYPGNDITWDETPEIMKAARQSLLYRGDAGTGWSLAWKINFWARFRDGDHAFKMVQMLISPAAKGGGSYPNLFDAHPPFQIDGNFGGAAGMAEMLLQSHSKFIDLLPALPTSWPNGTVRGICARGGFVLDMHWEKGQLQWVEVLSKAGYPCHMRYAGKEINFPTRKGVRYRFSGGLTKLATNDQL